MKKLTTPSYAKMTDHVLELKNSCWHIPALWCFLSLLGAILISASSFAQKNMTTNFSRHKLTEADAETPNEVNKAALQKNSSMLWSNHDAWTRKVMLCVSDEHPSSPSIDRLLKNQDAIAGAMHSYYGDSAGRSLSVLLYEHKAITAEIERAAKAGDNEAHALAHHQSRLNKIEIVKFMRMENSVWAVAEYDKANPSAAIERAKIEKSNSLLSLSDLNEKD
jgi:hypothetical protein